MALAPLALLTQAEVGYLEHTVLVEQVLRLQVSVEVAPVVDKGKTHQRLLHDRLDLVIRQALGPPEPLIVPHVVENGATEELKDQVYVVLHPDNLLEFHNVRMVQPPQRLDLPKTHGFIPTFKFLFHFLDRDCFLRCSINGFDYSAVSAISTIFDYLKLVHNFFRFRRYRRQPLFLFFGFLYKADIAIVFFFFTNSLSLSQLLFKYNQLASCFI